MTEKSGGTAFNTYIIQEGACAATSHIISFSAEQISRVWNIPLDEVEKRLAKLKKMQEQGTLSDNHFEHFFSWVLKKSKQNAKKSKP